MKIYYNFIMILVGLILAAGCADKKEEKQVKFIYLTENNDTLTIDYNFAKENDEIYRVEDYYLPILKKKEWIYGWTDTLYDYNMGVFRKTNSLAYFVDFEFIGKLDAAIWIPYSLIRKSKDTVFTLSDWMQMLFKKPATFTFPTKHTLISKGKVFNNEINDSLFVLERSSEYLDIKIKETIYYEKHLIPVEYIFKYPSYDNKIYHYYLKNKNLLKEIDNIKEFKEYF